MHLTGFTQRVVSRRENISVTKALKTGAMLIGNLIYLSSLLVAKRIEQVTHVDSSHNEAMTIEVKLLDRDG